MTTTAPLRGAERCEAAPRGLGDARWFEAYAVASRFSGLAGVAVEALIRTSFLPDHPGERHRIRAHFLQSAARDLCALHGMRVHVDGRLPDPPFVLVANHVSYVDPLILAALTPCTAIAKQEIGAWPILGARLRDVGVLLVDRESPLSGARVLKGALRALRHGVPVLSFPEGTTTQGDTVLPFRKGLFGIARIAGVPIVPAALAYADPELCWTGDDTFLPHYVRLSRRRSADAAIAIGAPIVADHRDSPADLAARARDAILTLLPR